MTTTPLIEATYTQIAAGLAASAKQINFLLKEKERILAEYAAADPEGGSFVGFVGEKLVDQLDKAILTLNSIAKGEHDLLSQKLAEPVERQLGLGLWQEAAV